jgi:hypothetical protein
MDALLKVFFWSIMEYYSQDAHWMKITSNDILGGISKWYIIAIIVIYKINTLHVIMYFLK